MQFEIFEDKSIIQGVSDASFGSMRSGKNAVKFLRAIAPKSYEVSPRKIIWAQQVFGARVHICKPEDAGKVIKNIDGLISNISGQILATITADCVPILLYDSKNQVAGALHGSRKSLVGGIIKNAVQKMILQFGSSPKDILVGIGPHIRVCHYWLKGEALRDLKNTAFKKYFSAKNKKIYFNLTKLALDHLRKFGIPRKNIEDCQICTFCKWQKYFSARKEEENAAMYKEKKPVFASFIGVGSQSRILSLSANVTRKDLVTLTDRMVEVLRSGGTVIFPTDTVYGLGSNALNEKAVKKIFEIKKRPKKKALPVFVKDIKMAKKLACINRYQEKFLKKAWPGKVTVVLRKKKNIPKIICGESEKIGLRIPAHKFIQKLLEKANFPIVGTSANISGEPASGKIKEVLQQFKNQKHQPDLIIDAGNLPKSLFSTVVDSIEKLPKILRKGASIKNIKRNLNLRL